MPRPVPTPLYHFTPIHHLASIIEHGLLCDSRVAAGLLAVEVGNRGIKEQRRRRAVPVGPCGMVADYVPFYFAPRSPMLYAVAKGNVPEYTGGMDPLVYLITTADRLAELGLPMLFTDRNAVLETARFTRDPAGLDALIDWPLMRARMWHNTPSEPDRRERRMAECLVHRQVPWQAIEYVAARTPARAAQARATLARFSQGAAVRTRRDWYFS
ncbi:MAG: type II toxin-antitoxin system toxin DNA ADP-ribosyl transferase DarT [Pseudonocardiaceae bacterium]